MESKTIRFIRQGALVALNNVPSGRTLLEVLREDLGLTGTKEGCGEGDCGACTVVLGELEQLPAGQGERIRYRAINSCIRLAHSVDGMALWTVEDLAAADGSLHPAQQAMVQWHGSQCGFCTPGFVMSLFAMYQNHVCRGESISRQLAQEELSGNLCRCTGYRPILEAAQRMARLPAVRLDEEALLRQLQSIRPASGRGTQYLAPRGLAALLAARAAHPGAQIVAGCTDVGLWVTKLHLQLGQVLDLTGVQELRRVERYDHHIAIGAAVTLSDAFDALVAQRPQLKTFVDRFAGLAVRNAGTLGGNVANGSPIGDSMPLLIALGAHVVLLSIRGHREMPLEDFYTGYRKNVLAPDEVLAWIKVPRPLGRPAGGSPHPNPPPEGEGKKEPPPARGAGLKTEAPSPPGAGLKTEAPSPSGGGLGWGQEFLRAYKISKRFDDDISAVCLAINLAVEDGIVGKVSIGAGGVAPTPVRAIETEASLRGKPWSPETVQQAAATLRAEFQPISDLRASAAYRSQVLGNLMQRFWLESQGAGPVNLESFSLQEAQA